MLIRRIPSFPDRVPSLRGLDEVRRDMERWFDAFGAITGPRTAGVFPATNISETGDALLIRAELPGIKPDDLEVTVEGNTLTIAGTRQTPIEPGAVSAHRREREWGSFRRSLTVPSTVESGRIEARYSDGILTVRLPKAAEARPKQITVQAGA